ncbi:unnamed protein product [Ceratitis capitata]|uniref:(Mediterranean fruit fly) hypothetical protein n=1 Tax=Ceratitis capitata TaxID=7213 RepID=A0A811V265_CERCA|nr:unnamed protein product [Ceratitis capitata]
MCVARNRLMALVPSWPATSALMSANVGVLNSRCALLLYIDLKCCVAPSLTGLIKITTKSITTNPTAATSGNRQQQQQHSESFCG